MAEKTKQSKKVKGKPSAIIHKKEHALAPAAPTVSSANSTRSATTVATHAATAHSAVPARVERHV